MKITKKDWLFLAFIALVLAVFIIISGEEKTKKVPFNDKHREAYEIMKQTGSKKAAEKGCMQCHNEAGVPYPKDHPPKNRCLFCHKLEKGH